MYVSTSSAPSSSAANAKPSLSELSKPRPNTNLQASALNYRSLHRSTHSGSCGASPFAAFRDSLYKYLETVPEGDFDGYANKLITAGTSLEFLKYSDALFEILFAGGLLQPGGSYLDDGAPPSPFSINNAKEPVAIEELKKFVDVFNKVIRRYKYLQKPLEESSLPSLLQYCIKWPAAQRDKVTLTTGLLITQGLATVNCILPLAKDQLVKDDVALGVITPIFRTILTEQSVDAFAAHMKRSGVKDLLDFFPNTRRDLKHLETYFKNAGLPQVVDWYVKRRYAMIREEVASHLKEMAGGEESTDSIVEYVKNSQSENPLPESELVPAMWQALMSTVDWSVARPDQIDSMALKEVTRIAGVLEPFCSGAKTQVALINAVQVYCYEDTKIIKTFPHILKVLYNKDCVSDQAIIYWHQKGAKSQGKQHFLKAAEPLVKFLREQEDESEEEE
ncbi:hypothetical protein FRB99_007778 [Tulasnella sp. 403]|nr:hypothetical protein FRB99_007778 [Tulasnella sp. 403]